MSSAFTAGKVPDVYGQVHPDESPELVQEKLAEFDAGVLLLTQQKNEKNRELCDAIRTCPELLTTEFKLMFLRCELFNTDLAVKRYSSYWKKRVKIFGPDKAFQPLTLDKALSEDRVALELGLMRLVTGVTDPKGRAIVYVEGSVLDRTKYTSLSMCRALWYVIHAALESESAQKYGVIFFADPRRTKYSQIDLMLSKIMVPTVNFIPLRLSAVHCCHPPAFMHIVLPIFKMLMTERLSKRIVLHSGSTEKVLGRLSKRYGIDKSVLPTALGGHVSLDHHGWVMERRSSSL